MCKIILFALALAAPVHAAPCPDYKFRPVALTAAGTRIAPGGGVVMYSTWDGDTDAHGETDAAIQPTFRFRDGAKLSQPAITSIAPGLAVYVLPATGKELVDDKRVIVAFERSTARVPALAAPKPETAGINEELSGPRGRERRSTIVTVGLADPPPAAALALVVYADGKPITWTKVTDKTTKTLVVYRVGACSVMAPGIMQPQPKTRLTLAWLDGSGKLSPQSTAFVLP